MPADNIASRNLTRRQILKYGLFSTAAAGASSLFPSCGNHRYRGPARHVILISLDTTRRDHLGCYEDPWIRTPNLDALARESILFSDHITPVTTTLAAHVSLFTGKYPHNHGIPRNGYVINPGNVLLPEILKGAGFHTAGFLGSFSLDRRFGFARGFDDFDQNFDIMVGDQRADQNQRRAAAVTSAVTEFLGRKGVPRNLFLFAHYFDPHQPYIAPSPFDTLYAGSPEDPVPDVAHHPVLQFGGYRPDYELTMLRYAREVTYMDGEIGRLFTFLRAKRVLDESIVIVCSDHGENLGDAPGGKAFDHGWTVYEPEVRAVLLVRLPGGQAGGTRCAVPTSHVDLLPTLLRYLGLTAPGGIDGLALDLPHVQPPPGLRLRFAEATKPWGEVESDPRWMNVLKPCSVWRGPHKYIRTSYRKTEELFDLSQDPREERNLLKDPKPEDAATAAELRQALAAWTAEARPLPARFESTQQKETMERLRSLGYL
jgi:arylsulfatase A-like enzyme